MLAGAGVVFATLFLPSKPAVAEAVGSPLSIQPSSGAVGSEVTLRLTNSSNCGAVVFEPMGPSTTSNAVGVGDGSPTELIKVPSFVGTAPAIAVTPGRYQFAVSCTTPFASGFTTYTARFTVSSAVSIPARFVGMAPTPDGDGYWLAQAGGGVYSYGDAKFEGSLPGLGFVPAAPIVGIAASPGGGGYWLVAADGGVFAFGDAKFEGSLPGLGIVPAAPIVGIAANHFGAGYWLIGGDGGVFAFAAPFCTPQIITPGGSPIPDYVQAPAAAVSIAPGVGSIGYDDIDTEGFGFTFPAPSETCNPATTNQSFGTIKLPQGVTPSAQISGIATTFVGERLWLVGIDGGVFAPNVQTGQELVSPSPFFGSLPVLGVMPAAPVVGIAATPDGGGYWLVAADGGVFAFGDARFFGSAPA